MPARDDLIVTSTCISRSTFDRDPSAFLRAESSHSRENSLITSLLTLEYAQPKFSKPFNAVLLRHTSTTGQEGTIGVYRSRFLPRNHVLTT